MRIQITGNVRLGSLATAFGSIAGELRRRLRVPKAETRIHEFSQTVGNCHLAVMLLPDLNSNETIGKEPSNVFLDEFEATLGDGQTLLQGSPEGVQRHDPDSAGSEGTPASVPVRERRSDVHAQEDGGLRAGGQSGVGADDGRKPAVAGAAVGVNLVRSTDEEGRQEAAPTRLPTGY